MVSPSLSVTKAFFQLGWWPMLRPTRLFFPRITVVRTARTWTLKSFSTACLTWILVASR